MLGFPKYHSVFPSSGRWLSMARARWEHRTVLGRASEQPWTHHPREPRAGEGHCVPAGCILLQPLHISQGSLRSHVTGLGQLGHGHVIDLGVLDNRKNNQPNLVLAH